MALDVYVEVGTQKAFAVVRDWPGWARGGRDENAALAALIEYGARYQAAVGASAEVLTVPDNPADLRVVEHLQGNATTDFGAPGAIPDFDLQAPDEDELARLTGLLRASWAAFEKSADAAKGVDLAPSGPRGGGRSLAKIRAHVTEADGGYLRALGGRADANADWPTIHQLFVTALGERARGELPDVGPRGGKRWPARFAVRRSAWHALDHAWEIEDRAAR